MKDIFLSIDLDYWDCINYSLYRDINDSWSPKINREKLFDTLKTLKIPIKIYVTHDQMVNQINKSKCTTIINIDFHSDLIVFEHGDKLDEGRVFNFISNKRQKTYIWILPFKEIGYRHGYGRCDYGSDIEEVEDLQQGE